MQAETGAKAQKDNKANTKINKNTKFNANSEWEDRCKWRFRMHLMSYPHCDGRMSMAVGTTTRTSLKSCISIKKAFSRLILLTLGAPAAVLEDWTEEEWAAWYAKEGK